MQRPSTKQSPSADAAEKRFMSWTKDQDCITCGSGAGSIVHHCYGSSRKERLGVVKVMTGHLAVIPLCLDCDDIITQQSRRVFVERFGKQCELWIEHVKRYPDLWELDLMKCMAIAGCGE